MKINYYKQPKFLDRCEIIIRENRIHLSEGHTISADFQGQGFHGKVRIEISSEDNFYFETDWQGTDRTLFPVIIHSVASAMLRQHFFIKLDLTYDKDQLHIKRVFCEKDLKIFRKETREVNHQDGTDASEAGLPLPVVHYPGFYGTFIGFSKKLDSGIYFCSCAYKAIEHFIRFQFEDKDYRNSSEQFILSAPHFPQRVVDDLIDANIPNNTDIIKKLKFRNDLCHECNKLTPFYSYCLPMYGGTFEQNYGWYINKQSFEYGVMPRKFRILQDVCPDEVFSSSDIEKTEFINTYNKYSDYELILLNVRDSDFQKKTRKIRNIIENEVRVKFGFKKVGDAWANETLLFQLISEIFPAEKIIRHYRPDFLDYLELDIFIPKLKIGIEYQGIQHFKPIIHWGGKAALEKTKERDSRKKALCRKNGLNLIYFYYTEELSKTLIKEKLDNLRKSLK